MSAVTQSPSRRRGMPAALDRARWIGERYPILQVAAVFGLYEVGVQRIEGYGSLTSIRSMLVLASFLGIAAAGQTMVVLLGGMDISVPFVIGAANVTASQLSGKNHWPFILVALLITVLALAIGAANGYVSHRFEIHPLIVTLGIGSIVAGAVLVWTQANLGGVAPKWIGTFVSPGRDTWFIPMPPVVVFWAVFSVIVIVILAKTPVGRRLYATGANPRGARLALTSTTAVWMGTFAASAFCAALTGVLLAGFSGLGLFDIGQPYLFTTIASVVIGGTSLLGARGDYFRTVLGVLILIQIQTLLVGFGFDPASQQIVTGLLIVGVVTIYGREASIRSRI